MFYSDNKVCSGLLLLQLHVAFRNLTWSLAKDTNSQPLAGGLGEATGIAIRRNVMDFDAVVTFGGKGTLIQNSGGLCEVGTVGIQRGSNQQRGVNLIVVH